GRAAHGELHRDQAPERHDEKHEPPAIAEATAEVGTQREEAGCGGHVPHHLTKQCAGLIRPAVIHCAHALRSNQPRSAHSKGAGIKRPATFTVSDAFSNCAHKLKPLMKSPLTPRAASPPVMPIVAAR